MEASDGDRSLLDYHLETAPGHLIRRAQQRHQAIWNDLVGSRLTSVQFAVLMLLSDAPGLDQRTVGDRLSVDSSTLADVCRRMEQRSLIERDRSSDDSRRYVLTITTAGRDLLAQTIPTVDEVGERVFGDLDEQERALLVQLLHRIVDRPE